MKKNVREKKYRSAGGPGPHVFLKIIMDSGGRKDRGRRGGKMKKMKKRMKRKKGGTKEGGGGRG